MKKNKELYTILGLGFLAYLLMPKKANAEGLKQIAPAGAVANPPISLLPTFQEQKLTIPQTALIPSGVVKDTDKEAESGVNWNFGMIANTSKFWFGEYASKRTGKNFINRYAGLAALMYLLSIYIKQKGLNTIRKIGTLWEAKNKSLWIEKVSQYTGFSPDAPLQADTSFIFPLAYAIAAYYQPKAKDYISVPIFFVALEQLAKYYKTNLE